MDLHLCSNFDQKISYSLLTPRAATNPLFWFLNQVMLTASDSFSFWRLQLNLMHFTFAIGDFVSTICALNLNKCLCFCSRFGFS